MATTTLNVQVSGVLSDHIASNIGEYGRYENVSEYVRDLIRRDHERVEDEKFRVLKDELQRAFAAPDSAFHESTPEDVFARAAAHATR